MAHLIALAKLLQMADDLLQAVSAVYENDVEVRRRVEHLLLVANELAVVVRAKSCLLGRLQFGSALPGCSWSAPPDVVEVAADGRDCGRFVVAIGAAEESGDDGIVSLCQPAAVIHPLRALNPRLAGFYDVAVVNARAFGQVVERLCRMVAEAALRVREEPENRTRSFMPDFGKKKNCTWCCRRAGTASARGHASVRLRSGRLSCGRVRFG